MKVVKLYLLIIFYFACLPAYADGRWGLYGESISVALVFILTIVNFIIVLFMKWRLFFNKLANVLLVRVGVSINLFFWGFSFIFTFKTFISGDYRGGQPYEFIALFGELFIALILIYFLYRIPQKQFKGKNHIK
ncbi:MAG: hypothetical protein GQ582_06750 [Methyloprofundus sp.]|nr:hypothetical protein [Methyloprofundus sp.]